MMRIVKITHLRLVPLLELGANALSQPTPKSPPPASSGAGLQGRGLGVDATASRLHAVNGVGSQGYAKVEVR